MGKPKLNLITAQEIRNLAGTLTQEELGKRFGVRQATVSAIVLGKIWTGRPRARCGVAPKPTADRFWPKVRIGGADECWPFTGYINPDTGYGMLRVSVPERKQEMAHRIAWILAYGPLKPGEWVLHSCDNPPCCNPKHLFLGDHGINMKDVVDKNRFVGRRDKRKLSYYQVLEIRELAKTGMRQHVIAELFGIGQPNVSSIILGKTWRSEPGPFYEKKKVDQ